MLRVNWPPCGVWLRRITVNGGRVRNATLAPVDEDGNRAEDNSDSVSRVGYGWFATGSISAGTPYLVIPSSLTMGSSTSTQSRALPILLTLRRAFKGIAGPKLESIELYAFVHFEKFVEGNGSFWAPYLASIPDSFPQLPLFYSQQHKDILSSLPQGGYMFSSYFAGVEVVLGALADVLATLFPRVYGVGTKEGMEALKHQLKWAFCALHTRAVGNSHSHTPPRKLRALLPMRRRNRARPSVCQFKCAA